jgi:hypothetical protein
MGLLPLHAPGAAKFLLNWSPRKLISPTHLSVLSFNLVTTVSAWTKPPDNPERVQHHLPSSDRNRGDAGVKGCPY